jgi:hypothetical protein
MARRLDFLCVLGGGALPIANAESLVVSKSGAYETVSGRTLVDRIRMLVIQKMRRGIVR